MKVLDYRVMSKECAACRRLEGKDTNTRGNGIQNSLIFVLPNVGSSTDMEPKGIERSLNDDIIYKYLASDGDDNKALNLICEVKPCGKTNNKVEKKDCIGHIQERMGIALWNLKTKHRREKLLDGRVQICALGLILVLYLVRIFCPFLRNM